MKYMLVDYPHFLDFYDTIEEAKSVFKDKNFRSALIIDFSNANIVRYMTRTDNCTIVSSYPIHIIINEEY